MRWLASAAAVALLTFSPAAKAQFIGGSVVYCTNCSQEVNEIIRWAQSLSNQVSQISYQIQQINWLIANTVSLPSRLFADLTSPIRQVQQLVNQVSMFSENAKWMIGNIGHPSGYGGSLADIPLALAQENNALASAMWQLGLVHQQLSNVTVACNMQYAAMDDGSAGAGGIKSASQAGNAIGATAGQCAEAREQFRIAAANASATAQLRLANRQALFDAATQAHLNSAVGAGCASLASGGGSSWACDQQTSNRGG